MDLWRAEFRSGYLSFHCAKILGETTNHVEIALGGIRSQVYKTDDGRSRNWERSKHEALDVLRQECERQLGLVMQAIQEVAVSPVN